VLLIGYIFKVEEKAKMETSKNQGERLPFNPQNGGRILL
jgi:hypothetical protein